MDRTTEAIEREGAAVDVTRDLTLEPIPSPDGSVETVVEPTKGAGTKRKRSAYGKRAPEPHEDSLARHYQALLAHAATDKSERRFVRYPAFQLTQKFRLTSDAAEGVVKALCDRNLLSPDPEYPTRRFYFSEKAPPDDDHSELQARIEELEERLAHAAGQDAVLTIRQRMIDELQGRVTSLEIRNGRADARIEELETLLSTASTLAETRASTESSSHTEVSVLEGQVRELQRYVSQLEETCRKAQARNGLPFVMSTVHSFRRGRGVWLSKHGVADLFARISPKKPVPLTHVLRWLKRNEKSVRVQETRDERERTRGFYSQQDVISTMNALVRERLYQN